MTHSALLRLLCELLAPSDVGTKGRVAQSWRPEILPDLMAMADAFRVLPRLYHALRRRGLLDTVDTDLAEALHAVWLLNRARNADLMRQARDMTAALAEIDITPVFIKGMAHILGETHMPGARMTSDMDVLVPEARYDEALLQLQAQGWGPGYDGPTPITWHRVYAHSAVPIHRAGDPAWIDLHKGFFSDPDYLLPGKDIVAKARPVALEGWQAHIPCPEHQVVLSFAHATLRGLSMLGGSANLRDGLDIIAVAQKTTIDFASIEARFAAAGASGAYKWYSAAMAELFGPDAISGQPQAWSLLTSARARATLAVWMRPALQRSLAAGSPLAYGLQAFSDRRFRKHFVLLATDKTYRTHWRGGEH